MKQFTILLLMAFALISAGVAVNDNYTIAKGYTVTINGTSNLHNWTETVGTVTGSSVVSTNSDGSFNMETLTIKIEVRSIKSTEGGAMNNNTYKALKADADPEITFTLTTPLRSIKTAASAITVSAHGTMTIAGVTKPVIMQVKASMPQKGTMEFEGTQAIKMTDYGISPPTALFGALKTGDDITITFKTDFSQNN